jgi:cell division protein FtsL
MATIATAINRMFPKSVEPGEDVVQHGLFAGEESTRVRPFANEDITLWIKRVDNTRVVRKADPAASGMCWKLIGTAVAAAVLLIAVLLPSAYGLMAGYQIQQLREEGERLSNELSSLELEQTSLVSPARMDELARMQQFIDPAPQKLIYLDGRSLAFNKKK